MPFSSLKLRVNRPPSICTSYAFPENVSEAHHISSSSQNCVNTREMTASIGNNKESVKVNRPLSDCAFFANVMPLSPTSSSENTFSSPTTLPTTSHVSMVGVPHPRIMRGTGLAKAMDLESAEDGQVGIKVALPNEVSLPQSDSDTIFTNLSSVSPPVALYCKSSEEEIMTLTESPIPNSTATIGKSKTEPSHLDSNNAALEEMMMEYTASHPFFFEVSESAHPEIDEGEGNNGEAAFPLHHQHHLRLRASKGRVESESTVAGNTNFSAGMLSSMSTLRSEPRGQLIEKKTEMMRNSSSELTPPPTHPHALFSAPNGIGVNKKSLESPSLANSGSRMKMGASPPTRRPGCGSFLQPAPLRNATQSTPSSPAGMQSQLTSFIHASKGVPPFQSVDKTDSIRSTPAVYVTQRAPHLAFDTGSRSARNASIKNPLPSARPSTGKSVSKKDTTVILPNQGHLSSLLAATPSQEKGSNGVLSPCLAALDDGEGGKGILVFPQWNADIPVPPASSVPSLHEHLSSTSNMGFGGSEEESWRGSLGSSFLSGVQNQLLPRTSPMPQHSPLGGTILGKEEVKLRDDVERPPEAVTPDTAAVPADETVLPCGTLSSMRRLSVEQFSASQKPLVSSFTRGCSPSSYRHSSTGRTRASLISPVGGTDLAEGPCHSGNSIGVVKDHRNASPSSDLHRRLSSVMSNVSLNAEQLCSPTVPRPRVGGFTPCVSTPVQMVPSPLSVKVSRNEEEVLERDEEDVLQENMAIEMCKEASVDTTSSHAMQTLNPIDLLVPDTTRCTISDLHETTSHDDKDVILKDQNIPFYGGDTFCCLPSDKGDPNTRLPPAIISIDIDENHEDMKKCNNETFVFSGSTAQHPTKISSLERHEIFSPVMDDDDLAVNHYEKGGIINSHTVGATDGTDTIAEEGAVLSLVSTEKTPSFDVSKRKGTPKTIIGGQWEIEEGRVEVNASLNELLHDTSVPPPLSSIPTTAPCPTLVTSPASSVDPAHGSSGIRTMATTITSTNSTVVLGVVGRGSSGGSVVTVGDGSRAGSAPHSNHGGEGDVEEGGAVNECPGAVTLYPVESVSSPVCYHYNSSSSFTQRPSESSMELQFSSHVMTPLVLVASPSATNSPLSYGGGGGVNFSSRLATMQGGKSDRVSSTSSVPQQQSFSSKDISPFVTAVKASLSPYNVHYTSSGKGAGKNESHSFLLSDPNTPIISSPPIFPSFHHNPSLLLDTSPSGVIPVPVPPSPFLCASAVPHLVVEPPQERPSNTPSTIDPEKSSQSSEKNTSIPSFHRNSDGSMGAGNPPHILPPSVEILGDVYGSRVSCVGFASMQMSGNDFTSNYANVSNIGHSNSTVFSACPSWNIQPLLPIRSDHTILQHATASASHFSVVDQETANSVVGPKEQLRSLPSPTDTNSSFLSFQVSPQSTSSFAAGRSPHCHTPQRHIHPSAPVSTSAHRSPNLFMRPASSLPSSDVAGGPQNGGNASSAPLLMASSSTSMPLPTARVALLAPHEYHHPIASHHHQSDAYPALVRRPRNNGHSAGTASSLEDGLWHRSYEAHHVVESDFDASVVHNNDTLPFIPYQSVS